MQCGVAAFSTAIRRFGPATEWRKPPIRENRQVQRNWTPIEQVMTVCATRAVTSRMAMQAGSDESVFDWKTQ